MTTDRIPAIITNLTDAEFARLLERCVPTDEAIRYARQATADLFNKQEQTMKKARPVAKRRSGKHKAVVASAKRSIKRTRKPKKGRG